MEFLAYKDFVEERRATLGRIADAMAAIEKNSVLNAIKDAIQRNEDPLGLIEGLRLGLEMVGDNFEKGKYIGER